MAGDVEEKDRPQARKLIDDKKSRDTIISMWTQGEQNIGKIAREIHHPYRVVALEIDSLIKEGELEPKKTSLGGRILESLTDRAR